MFAPSNTHGGRVIVTPIDAKRWRLVESLRYAGLVNEFIVPAGYITDFASVPRITSWLVPSYGIYTPAAILHDWLLTDILPTGRICSNDIDGLFRRAMRELGVPPVRRWLMWTGVRWGALFNKRRRDGWWVTAPAVLAISVPAFVAFVIPVIFVALGLCAYSIVEGIATRGKKRGSLTT